MQTVIETIVGAVIILAVAFVFASPPVRAGECAGQTLTASWYGTESGSRTANGEHFNGQSMTAAMPSRKFLGQHYRVTYARTGKSVVVRINDLGPAAWTGRGIDLSEAAARRIGMHHAGVGRVCISRVR